MNSKAGLAAAGLALTWLVACGSPTPHEPAAQQDDAGPAADVEARHGTRDETVFDDMIRTEDKARSVEGTVMQGKANTDAAIEAADGGAAGPDQEQQ
jgi:hypothetical protein